MRISSDSQVKQVNKTEVGEKIEEENDKESLDDIFGDENNEEAADDSVKYASAKKQDTNIHNGNRIGILKSSLKSIAEFNSI